MRAEASQTEALKVGAFLLYNKFYDEAADPNANDLYIATDTPNGR